eukprot:CAMPEP_0201559116 /NCGR_PEP_ID=MMETSP0173_2-20130828/71874_1 /ASSEMBLY_ACC=CAM_ASM_000268 /TAXON_ID=218659 /ORGANISM="Vexillifera sp., Strain DIVA3 564/2" /LENGTH=43 /DNA_ID= /DNA_START= /DNA_END= /DNA_ORIENTATION=
MSCSGASSRQAEESVDALQSSGVVVLYKINMYICLEEEEEEEE